MKDLTMSMFANRQDYEAAVAAQKAMTPHDELMALAGKATPGEWTADTLLPGNVYSDDATGSIIATCRGFRYAPRSDDETEANAAFIAAACNFVRSDAFRAMVRDVERWRLWRDDTFIDRVDLAALPDEQMEAAVDDAIKAAIDAAASGAGEGSP